jgi:hypothetical protein
MEQKDTPAYIPTEEERDAYNQVVQDVVKGRNIIQKSYNQFNGRTLYDCIDDWTKRWNGYVPMTGALTQDRSNMFLNFTRNLVISYLTKVGLTLPDIKVIAVNKKTKQENLELAKTLNDLIDFSNNEENAQTKFLETALECATKGTVIKYEGYLRYEQEMEIPDDFDPETGKMKTKKETRVLFDNCYQDLVPLEDFYIANPYQPDIQKQPFIIWRKITTYEEAEMEFGHYSKFKHVKAGNYTVTTEPTTFYRNSLQTELQVNQVEIFRYYNLSKNKHVILCNGVPIYNGIIPFKDGKYPFAKTWHEPFGNDFFWGSGFPQKIMGDQDLVNTIWNMMVDKTYGSLSAFGLSSDADDLVDDNILEPGKIRKVGDINNWRFETLPGVNAGEQAMLQTAISFVKDHAGSEGGASAQTARGGKVTMRQAVLKQQEAMSKLGFTMNYLEDFERDRTELRLAHILQFYSIPKMEKIVGKGGKEIEKLMYREISLPDSKLSDGKTGNKVIKMVDGADVKNENDKKKLEDDLSVIEEMGEQGGMPTEAIAISIDSFRDYNTRVQVVKNSSYEHNQLLDRAERMEYANWRLGIAQMAPVDFEELIKWVDESYDIDSDKFKPKNKGGQLDPQAMQMAGMQPGQQGQMPQPNQQFAPSKELSMDNAL